MSDPCRLLLVALWTLLTGCAPPPGAFDTGALLPAEPAEQAAPGWIVDPADPDRSWTWGAETLRVYVADTEQGDRTRGLWIEVDGVPISTMLPTGQRAPLIIAGTRADGTRPLHRIDGDRLVLALSGSTEHGCPADTLELALDIDPERRRLTVLLAGVPYVLLDAEPILITQDGRTRAAVLPGRGESWTSDRVRSVSGRVGGRPVGIAFRSPPPWLQLQRHGPALELDLDHGCEEPRFDGSFLSIQVLL